MSSITPISAAYSYATTASQPSLVAGTDVTGSTTDAGSNDAHIDAVSKDFEAVFLTQMLGAMFEGDDMTAFFGGGSTGEIYKGYLLDQYGKSIAQNGGIGIASAVKQELLKMQEIAA